MARQPWWRITVSLSIKCWAAQGCSHVLISKITKETKFQAVCQTQNEPQHKQIKVNVKYYKLHRKWRTEANKMVHQSLLRWFVFCQRLSLSEDWAKEVTRWQLRKKIPSLAFRNYLDSFSFPFCSFLSSSIFSLPLFLLVTCTEAAQRNYGLSILGGLEDKMWLGSALSNLLWWGLPWFGQAAPQVPLNDSGISLNCCVRQDAVVKWSVQSHNGLDFSSIWLMRATVVSYTSTFLPASLMVAFWKGIFFCYFIHCSYFVFHIFMEWVICSSWGYYILFTTSESSVMQFAHLFNIFSYFCFPVYSEF